MKRGVSYGVTGERKKERRKKNKGKGKKTEF
jgi:hypothetical protein